jgi:CHAD domain-containing protein
VRELDVEMLLIQELARDRRYPARALSQISATSAHAHAAARARLSAKLPAAKLKGLARSLERVAKDLESVDTHSDRRGASRHKRAWLWSLEARLARRAGRVRAAIDATGTVYVPERLHGVRIAVKKLRYAAELAASATRQRIAADLAVLKAAQDLLGRLHDFEMLRVRARDVQATVLPPDLRAWRDLGSLVHGIEDECRRLHARYLRDRTDLVAITSRMGASTRAAPPVSRRAAS